MEPRKKERVVLASAHHIDLLNLPLPFHKQIVLDLFLGLRRPKNFTFDSDHFLVKTPLNKHPVSILHFTSRDRIASISCQLFDEAFNSMKTMHVGFG